MKTHKGSLKIICFISRRPTRTTRFSPLQQCGDLNELSSILRLASLSNNSITLSLSLSLNLLDSIILKCFSFLLDVFIFLILLNLFYFLFSVYYPRKKIREYIMRLLVITEVRERGHASPKRQIELMGLAMPPLNIKTIM